MAISVENLRIFSPPCI